MREQEARVSIIGVGVKKFGLLGTQIWWNSGQYGHFHHYIGGSGTPLPFPLLYNFGVGISIIISNWEWNK